MSELPGDPVTTFGATLTVVSSTDVGEDVIYKIVKGVFDNLAQLNAERYATWQP